MDLLIKYVPEFDKLIILCFLKGRIDFIFWLRPNNFKWLYINKITIKNIVDTGRNILHTSLNDEFCSFIRKAKSILLKL